MESIKKSCQIHEFSTIMGLDTTLLCSASFSLLIPHSTFDIPHSSIHRFMSNFNSYILPSQTITNSSCQKKTKNKNHQIIPIRYFFPSRFSVTYYAKKKINAGNSPLSQIPIQSNPIQSKSNPIQSNPIQFQSNPIQFQSKSQSTFTNPKFQSNPIHTNSILSKPTLTQFYFFMILAMPILHVMLDHVPFKAAISFPLIPFYSILLCFTSLNLFLFSIQSIS